jgi:caspase domain-containing protein
MLKLGRFEGVGIAMPFVRAIFRTIAVLAVLGLAQAQAPGEGPRSALVIGNGDYSYAPLDNPVNDAEAVANALKDAGFDVMLETDGDRAKMQEAVTAFGDKLKERGGVGLFYFAGHGVQLTGENYLLPVGGHIGSEADIKTGAVAASEVVDRMAAANDKLNIFVLDACRNNPIDPEGTRGLSRVDSNQRLFVSYSTSPGMVALDGSGKNSPYTKHLAQSISAAGLSLEETFKRTLKGVYQETKGEQTPWIASTFFGDFIFRPGAAASSASPEAQSPQSAGSEERALLRPAPAPSQPEIAARLELGGIYRVSGINPNGSKYHGMLTLTQRGDEFRLVWWIGDQIFHGTGHFAGKMLMVNWGDKHPVIYSFGQAGALDGEWADGSATETLDPVAMAAPGDIAPAEGTYRVAGTNPDGSSYTGTLTLSKAGEKYRLGWRVGTSSYEGSGLLEGNVLTVDWGSATPVVYALGADGSLSGLWDAGKGVEKLTPED